MSERYAERRAHQRLSACLPMQVSGADFHCATDTRNISFTGLYCEVDRFVPVMTKLSLQLAVPLIQNKRKIERTVKGVGVVVRIEPEEPGMHRSYSIGLFFTDIRQSDKDIIQQYLRQALMAGNN